MSQNRNKLIDLFMGYLSTAISHQLLEKAIGDNPDIATHYRREIQVSWDLAQRYRNMINPLYSSLPEHDAEEIKRRIILRVTSELKSRISDSYQNIDLSLVMSYVNKALQDMKVT